MDIYDTVKLVVEGLKLAPPSGDAWGSQRIPNPALIKDTLRTTPPACRTITSAIDLGICIDSFCSHQSQYGRVSPSVDIQRFWLSWQDVIRSSNMRLLPSQAVIGKILNTYKDEFCKDQPPPPGAMVPVFTPVPVPAELPQETPARTGDCGYTSYVLPETPIGWFTTVGIFLGIIALRASQAATGSFFLFFMPEKYDSHQKGA